MWRSARTPEAEFRAITQAMKELGRRHGFDGPAASSMKAATVAQGQEFSGSTAFWPDRPQGGKNAGCGVRRPETARKKKDDSQTFVCEPSLWSRR
jgi:hypothetical protein